MPASALSRLACQRRQPAGNGAPVDCESYAVSPTPRWQEAWDRTADLLAATRDVAAALGAACAFLSASSPHGVRPDGLARPRRAWPAMAARAWDLDLPDRRLVEIAGRLGVPVLRLEPALHARAFAGDDVDADECC